MNLKKRALPVLAWGLLFGGCVENNSFRDIKLEERVQRLAAPENGDPKIVYFSAKANESIDIDNLDPRKISDGKVSHYVAGEDVKLYALAYNCNGRKIKFKITNYFEISLDKQEVIVPGDSKKFLIKLNYNLSEGDYFGEWFNENEALGWERIKVRGRSFKMFK